MKKSIIYKLLLIFVIALLAINLTGCLSINLGGDTTDSDSAKVSDLVMASDMDESTYMAINVADEFETDVETVYAIGKISGAEKDKTVVKAEWYYVENDLFINELEAIAGYNEGPFYFSLSKPDDGWPIGQYMVRIYIDNEESAVKVFKIK